MAYIRSRLKEDGEHQSKMRLSSFLGLSWLSAALAITPTGYDQIHWQDFTPSTYLNSTGLTDAVQWDGYSLFVNGERVFLYSGEVHRGFCILREGTSLTNQRGG